MRNERPSTRARRGAKLLDRKRPGWHKKINLETLRMQSCYSCILGQLYGFYFSGLEPILGRIKSYEKRTQKEHRHGFILTSSDQGYKTYNEEYEALAEAWKAEILWRRETEDES